MINKLILRGLLLGYAEMTVQSAPDKKDEEWHKQAYRISKYLKGLKKNKLTKIQGHIANKKYEACRDLDYTFFDNKQSSPYVCMLCILDYLINELEDAELKNRFGYIDIVYIREELETNKILKDVTLLSNKFLSAILDIIEK